MCGHDGARAALDTPLMLSPALHDIHLGHQHVLRAALGQGGGLGLLPDDVAGEHDHLLGREGDARAQAVLLGEGGASGHQGGVLRVVTGVAVQVALAGEGGGSATDDACNHQSMRGTRICIQLFVDALVDRIQSAAVARYVVHASGIRHQASGIRDFIQTV